MNYYTSTIPHTLAEKLKEKGMEMETLDEDGNLWIKPDYAMVFDWLMEKGYRITIHTKPANEPVLWFAYIGTMHPDYCTIGETKDCKTWHKASNAAIEDALTLI